MMSHLMSLSGVKRTYPFALHMSAFDPKRTLATPFLVLVLPVGYWTSVQLASGLDELDTPFRNPRWRQLW
jgi:hypothetical protein